MTNCPYCNGKKFIAQANPVRQNSGGSDDAWMNTCANSECGRKSVYDSITDSQIKLEDWTEKNI